MANHKSAVKSIRQNAARTVRNRSKSNEMKTVIKTFEAKVKNNDPTAKEAFVNAQSVIMKNVTKGIVKLNTASRKVRNLAAKLKNLIS